VDSDGAFNKPLWEKFCELEADEEKNTNSAIGGRVKYRLPRERWRGKVRKSLSSRTKRLIWRIRKENLLSLKWEAR